MGLFTGIANTIAGHKTMKEGKAMYGEGINERNAALASRKDLLEPDSLVKNVTLAEENLNAKSRIQILMEENADRSLARGLSSVSRYAGDSSSALQYALGVQDQSSQDRTSAALEGARDYARKEQNYYDRQDFRTQFAKTQYDLNVMMPYLQKLQFANDKVGSGQSMNMYGRQQKAEGIGGVLDGVANIGVAIGTGGLSLLAKKGGAGAGTPASYNAAQGWYGSNS